ncbi:hypothetical protein H6792_00005, partial [Candidatus Nomurabacteria bacterium]|nr:hypothetical protein [Candidatus Nomurabacteria bacterium]
MSNLLEAEEVVDIRSATKTQKDITMEIINLINLTPHAVNIVSDEGELLVSFPSVGVARAAQVDSPSGSLTVGEVEIPIVRTVFGEVVDLPEHSGDDGYIVSIITAQAAQAAGR